MYTTTAQEFEQFVPRSRASGMRWLTLIAAVLVVVILGVMTITVYRSGYVSSPLTNGEPTTTPKPHAITVDKVGQLQLRRLLGYGRIATLNWQPDDNRLIFTTTNGTIGYLNPLSLNAPPEIFEQRFLAKNAATLAMSSLSPDGKKLVLADYNKKVTFWDIETGEEHTSVLGQFAGINALAFSPDSSLVAGGANNNSIWIWNTDSGDKIAQWTENVAERLYGVGIGDVAFNSDGSVLAVANSEYNITLHDVVTGEVVTTLVGHKAIVDSVAFSPNGHTIASASKDGVVLLWDWRETGTQHVTLHVEGRSILRVLFSPDGRTLAAVSADNIIHLWDVIKVVKQGELRGHSDTIIDIAFSPDSQQLASASADETVRLWDVETAAEAQQVTLSRGQENGIISAVFSPDGKTLAAGGIDNMVWLWDVASGGEQVVMDTGGKISYGVAISPDGTRVAGVGNYPVIHVWDVTNGTEKTALEINAGDAKTVTFSPDGTLLATGGGSVDSNVHLWDAATGKPHAILIGHSGEITSVRFSPDGTLLASASTDHTIRLWEVVTGALYKILDSHDGTVWQVAFSPNGKTLASGGADSAIRLWDVETGNQLQVLEGSSSEVFALAYNPDGTLIASGSGAVMPGSQVPSLPEDTILRLWDVATGKQIGELAGHTMSIDAVAFSPDGSLLMSASEDGTIRLWGLPSAAGGG
ncbi:MAG: WD40 repeat domain-containing protein [Anaerolineae bacterium]